MHFYHLDQIDSAGADNKLETIQSSSTAYPESGVETFNYIQKFKIY